MSFLRLLCFHTLIDHRHSDTHTHNADYSMFAWLMVVKVFSSECGQYWDPTHATALRLLLPKEFEDVELQLCNYCRSHHLKSMWICDTCIAVCVYVILSIIVFFFSQNPAAIGCRSVNKSWVWIEGRDQVRSGWGVNELQLEMFILMRVICFFFYLLLTISWCRMWIF